jgi:type II secretion system protein I
MRRDTWLFLWTRGAALGERPSGTNGGIGTTRSPHRRRRSAMGFTLLEVLVALAVIAFAFVGLLGLHAHNIKRVASDQSLTRATLLARELVSQIQFQVETDGLQNLGDSSGTFDGYPGYRWEREVLSTGLDEMREVVIRVIWDERNPHACELVYFLRDPAV